MRREADRPAILSTAARLAPKQRGAKRRAGRGPPGPRERTGYSGAFTC